MTIVVERGVALGNTGGRDLFATSAVEPVENDATMHLRDDIERARHWDTIEVLNEC